MPPPRPLWRRAFDSGERLLAGPLEDLVQHEAFGVAVTIANRGLVATRSHAERASRRVLHALNVPAASDVNRLLNHIADVEREVRRLRQAITSGTPLERVASRPRGLPTTTDEG